MTHPDPIPRVMCPFCGERPVEPGRASCILCLDDMMHDFREHARQVSERQQGQLKGDGSVPAGDLDG